MKENEMFSEVNEVRKRVASFTALRIGALQTILGVAWMMISFFYGAYMLLADRLYATASYATPLYLMPWEEKLPLIIRDTAVLYGTPCILMIFLPILMGILIYWLNRFYNQKTGAYRPKSSLRDSLRDFLVYVVAGGIVILAIIFAKFMRILSAKYGLAPFFSSFPWFAIAFGFYLSIFGLFYQGVRRWYYPAIAIPLAGICFLPLMLNIDGRADWIEFTCYGAYGLALILLGAIDHIRLMRSLQPVDEMPDVQAV